MEMCGGMAVRADEKREKPSAACDAVQLPNSVFSVRG